MGYSQKYFQHQRPELARHVQEGNNRVLEIGCAEGRLGESLKKRGAATEVVGIEISAKAAKVAESKLDRVICGDIELMEHDELGLEPESFDYIICGDVLEHLRDPWTVLRWLVTRLKPGGHMIASLPNVRYWRVVFPLLFFGRWRYTDHGILDKTHLRFFTRKSSLQLFRQSGLFLVRSESLVHRKSEKIGNIFSLGLFSGLFTFQWILTGVKKKT